MTNFEFDNLAGGLNYRDTHVVAGKGQNLSWIESKNIKPYKNTGIEKCRGNTLILNHGTKIISAGNYDIANQEYIMFVDSAGKMYEYDTDGASKSAALMEGLNTSARGAWVVFGQGIIYSNGADEPFIYFRSRATTVSGTVRVASGSDIVTQDGGFTTTFTGYVQQGDSITINSEDHIIKEVKEEVTPDATVSVAIGTKKVKQDTVLDSDFTTGLEEEDPIIINGETHVIDSIEGEAFISGSVDVTRGSKIVSQAAGFTTKFTTDLEAGDWVRINLEDHKVDTVDSATQITLVTSIETAETAQPVTKHAQLTTVADFAATETLQPLRKPAQVITRSDFAATGTGKAVTRNKITYLIAVGSDGAILRSTAIAVYKGRVYIAYRGGIYWTAQGTYTDWLTAENAGYNTSFFNDSSTVQALSHFGDYLAIHRKQQVVLLNDTDGTPVNFVIKIKANRGSQSQFGTITVQNDHIFYDAGVFPLGQTGLLDQILLKAEVSAIINNDSTGFLNNRFDTSRANEVTILHYRNQREIWCYFPLYNLTYLQYVYIFDYQQSLWYRRVCPQETTCAIEHRNSIYSFDSGGKIYKEDLGTDWNGVDLSFYVQSAYINFGEGHQQKDIDEIKMIVDTSVENDFDYKFFFNYDNFNATKTQNISIKGDADCLYWADDQESITETEWAETDGSAGNDWAQEVLDAGYLDSYNGMKSISLYLSGSGTSQDLGLTGIKFLGVNINSV